MSGAVIPTAIVVALILINGLFVAAEFAIAGVSRPAMERRAKDGNRVARTIAQMLADPRKQDQYIATAQLGITFASLGLGMYGEHKLATVIYDYLAGEGWAGWLASHAVASIIAIAIFTYFHIVIGEMVPKALALQQPERTALWITPPMLWLKRLAILLVISLNATGNGILRLFGVRREHGAEQYYTSDELRFVVRESAEGGQLRESAAQVLQELFDFGALSAGDVMVPRVNVRGIEIGATPAQVSAVVREYRHTRYPIYERDLDHIAGMIHIKDLLKRPPDAGPITRFDARPVPFVPETSRVDSVLEIMRRRRTQLAVVIDEHGGTAGIVTIDDLFEEIIGDVRAGVEQKAEIYTDRTGRLHVAGIVRLEELGEHLAADLEHDEVETVSGLVLMLLDRPPQVGDVVTYKSIRLQVVAISGRGVGECVVARESRQE